MSKNLIPEIAKWLGVEIGEEFKVDKYDEMTFKFAENMLVARADFKGAKCGITYVVLSELLGGDVEIIKLPWKPEMFETYRSFDIVYGKLVICLLKWTGLPYQYALLDKGWIYRTREEAEAALPKVAAEMGVEYEL